MAHKTRGCTTKPGSLRTAQGWGVWRRGLGGRGMLGDKGNSYPGRRPYQTGSGLSYPSVISAFCPTQLLFMTGQLKIQPCCKPDVCDPLKFLC